MRTAAVTGATGFIGRSLVQRLLAKGYKVRVLSRQPDRASRLLPGAQVYGGDLAHSTPVPRAFAEGADVLYHCAGELKDPARMHALHVDGTARLLASASGRIGHWVQLSSVGAYGPVRSGLVDESAACAPVGPYETSKTLGDALAKDAVRTGGLTVTILRPSIVFGNDMPNQSLAQWVHAIRRGHFFYIGPRGAIVNYVHVSNVVQAMLLSDRQHATPFATYIVSESLPIEEFVGIVAQAVARPAPGFRVPRPVARALAALSKLHAGAFPLTPSRVDALTSRVEYGSSRARQELGWKPLLPLPLALQQFAMQCSAL